MEENVRSGMIDYMYEGVRYHVANRSPIDRLEREWKGNFPEIPEGSKILDFGCGPGHTTNTLGSVYADSTLVGVEVVLGRFFQNPFKRGLCLQADGLVDIIPESFDAVFALHNVAYMLRSLHPGFPDKNSAFFRRFLSLVNKGGVIAMSGYGRDYLLERVVLRRQDKEGLIFDIEQFKSEDKNAVNSFFPNLNSQLNYLKRAA